MPDTSSMARAARNVVVRSLGLRKNQNLLILAGVDSLDVAEVVTRAARASGVIASIIYVPRMLQSTAGPVENLPLPIEAAIGEADAVLSCLCNTPDCMQYRLRVLHTSWNHHTRIAHAPGMTLDILRMADTDYNMIGERCRSLALALILGKRLRITTTDHRGNSHELVVETSGWENPPGICDGVIPAGSWDNLPSGETHIVPRGGDGTIVINGSMPGHVLSTGEELLLTFRGGWLVDLTPGDSPAARHLQETYIAYAQRLGDSNWSNLAEIGFGLNPAIDRLMGVDLSDAKKAHTVHVALGHSITLGGAIESMIKCDLVTEPAKVEIDDYIVIERGQWRMQSRNWLPDYRQVAVPREWWEKMAAIRRSGVRAERTSAGLVCYWTSGLGRRESSPVGTEHTARLAAELYEVLPDHGRMLPKEALLQETASAGLRPDDLPGLLWVLSQYDLIRLQQEGGP